MDYETLNNNNELDDNSDFDFSYIDSYDLIDEYNQVMENSNISSFEELDDIKDIDFYKVVNSIEEETDYDDDVTGNIARKGKRSYNKLKEGENQFKKEFAEEFTMLSDLLDEVNKFGKKLDKTYETMSGSKTKGVSKYTNDLIQSILTTKTTKLQIVKEMTNLKKNIMDLQIKEGKRIGEEESSAEHSANSYFKEIMKVGRNNFITALDSPNITTDENLPDDLEFINAMPEYNNNLNDQISKRLEENNMRSEEANKYIAYENLNVELKIKYNGLNDEWKIIAVSDTGEEILDYPIPSRSDLGKVKFSSDHKYATDRYGRSYKVIEIYD